MEVKLDHYDKDLLVDTIKYRLYNDKLLITDDSLRNEIEDLLSTIEEDWV